MQNSIEKKNKVTIQYRKSIEKTLFVYNFLKPKAKQNKKKKKNALLFKKLLLFV